MENYIGDSCAKSSTHLINAAQTLKNAPNLVCAGKSLGRIGSKTLNFSGFCRQIALVNPCVYVHRCRYVAVPCHLLNSLDVHIAHAE